DIDYTIIIKNKNQVINTIKKMSKKLNFIDIEKGDSIKSKYISVHFLINNKLVDIAFFYKDNMDKFVNCLYKSKDNFLKYQHMLKHKIIDSIAVYDPNNLLISYKTKVNKFSKNITEKVYNDSMNCLKENLYAWKSQDFRNQFHFSYELQEIILNICLALYVKNKKLFMLPYKRLHKDLKLLKPNIEKEMYFLINGNNSKNQISKKIKTLEKIINKLEA
ncbi:MAG: hypothetical protein V1824_00210, partial [archaeon]